VRRLPAHGGADIRSLQLISALRAAEPAVFGLTGDPVSRPEGAAVSAWESSGDEALYDPRPRLDWLRDPDAHSTDRWFTERAWSRLRATVKRTGAGVAVLETLALQRYIAPLRDLGLRVVVDAHNVEAAVAAELLQGRLDVLSRRLVARLRLVEERAFAAADQVWVCGTTDAERVRNLYPDVGVPMVVPNTVPVERYAGAAAPEPATLVYPGSFAYPPNARAVSTLLEEVFPAFAERVAHARLRLVGERPTGAMLAAAERDPRVEVTGAVPDVVPHLAAASAVPVPLREGGGTRFKVLEAMAAGVPVVSSAKGVEGLEVTPGEHFLPAETATEMVDALVAVCTDPGLRVRLAERGRALVAERYDQDAADAAVVAALRQLDPT
jgi:glycosyltransferase involved in cell wall biosynthesis